TLGQVMIAVRNGKISGLGTATLRAEAWPVRATPAITWPSRGGRRAGCSQSGRHSRASATNVRLLRDHARAFSRRSQQPQRDAGKNNDAEKPCGDERSRVGRADDLQLKPDRGGGDDEGQRRSLEQPHGGGI